jgi:hypothetical protein
VVFTIFCRKHLEEATDQGGYRQVEGIVKVKEEKKFEARFKELEKILNDDAKAWFFEQLSEIYKWTLAFDEGSCRYGFMTTNI